MVRVQAPGDAPHNNPLVAESADAPVSETGAAGHVRSTRTEGTNFQQSGSSAAEQRPHKAKAGGSCPPRTTNEINRPSTTKEVCHETDQRRRRVLSRSRASGARASRLRRESSAVLVSSAARRSSSRSSAATIPAHAAQRNRFKRCCLRSGCFRRRESRSLRALIGHRPCGCSSEAEQRSYKAKVDVSKSSGATNSSIRP
jgi:hypothetical protein